MNELEQLIKLSKWAGERFDLVQAGGGNTSVKLSDDKMIIKASGCHLSEMTATRGYVEVSLPALKKLIETPLDPLAKGERAQYVVDAVAKTVCSKSKSAPRPSLETVVHVLLEKVALHCHSIVANAVAMRKNGKEILLELFPDALCLEYQTPGIDLAVALDDALTAYREQHGKVPAIIFLRNHGLIVHGQSAEEVQFLTEEVVMKLEQFLGMTENVYRLAQRISSLVNAACSSQKIAYPSNDDGLKRMLSAPKKLFFQRPFCPDVAVYCGMRMVILDNVQDAKLFDVYFEKFSQAPKVVIYNGIIFFIGDNVKQARDSEDMLKFHLSTLVINFMHNIDLDTLDYLSDEETLFLGNWESEKYRSSLT